MFIINAANTCEALVTVVAYLLREGQHEQSRAGEVLVAPCPVMTVTQNPEQRVLFSAARDANIFFHTYEALWLLAGRQDVAPLEKYISRFVEYAEPDGNVHGAYGWRWRHAFGFDQLDRAVEILKRDPRSRQVVIQMWDPSTIGNDLLGSWKDRPCNTNIYLRVRDGCLDLTVCCRSNDMIWGCMGANSFSFSVLLSYLAERLGLKVGILYQLSNNAHIYIAELERIQQRAGVDIGDLAQSLVDDRYATQGLHPVPLVGDPKTFDDELGQLLAMVDSDAWDEAPRQWRNDFLGGTALPLLRAHSRWRAGRREQAYEGMEQVWAPDWRAAGQEWMTRRLKRGVQS